MQHTFYSWFGPSRPLKKHIGFIGEGKKSQKWCRKSSIIGYNWDSRSSSRETRNKLAKPFFRRCAFNQRPMLSDLNGFDKLQIFPIDKNKNFNCSHYNLVLVVKSDNLQFVCPKSIRNYKKNAWNIRRLVDESFVLADYIVDCQILSGAAGWIDQMALKLTSVNWASHTYFYN